jgi:tetratricopeptide (TPR) repeat protein
VGVPVYAVGAPQGLELSLSDGIVSQLRGGPPPLIQTTAAISPGSSGGGLFDGEGRLVGLTALYVEGGQSLNFAMPVEWISEAKQGRKQVAGGRSQTEWRMYAAALTVTKNWELMLDLCLKWTKSEPDDAYAWDNLGTAYLDLNRHNDAIDAFRQSIRIKPEDAGVWAMLGSTYNLLNRYDDAIEAFRQSIRINPENASYWYNLGITYKYRRLDSFGGACQPIIGASAARQAACSGLKRDSYKDVIEAFRQAIRIDPEYTKAWDNLGFTYSELSRYDDAIEAFRQAIRIDPKYADAWYNLAFTYALSGNRTASLDAIRELRRLDPERADKLFNLIVPR